MGPCLWGSASIKRAVCAMSYHLPCAPKIGVKRLKHWMRHKRGFSGRSFSHKWIAFTLLAHALLRKGHSRCLIP